MVDTGTNAEEYGTGGDEGVLADGSGQSDQPGQPQQGQPGGPPPGNEGRGSSLPGGFTWTPLTILAVVVLVGGVAAAGVFVGTGGDIPLVGDNGGASGPALDTVPEGADMVMYADAGVLEDQTTETLVDGMLSLSSQDPTDTGPRSYDEAMSEIRNQSDIDIDALHSTTMYAQYPEDSTADTEYVGMIVRSDWSDEELTATIEESGGSLQEQSYAGTTVYVQTQEFGADTWMASMGSGTYVIGTEASVTDAIDVTTGDMGAFSGDLRQSFDNLRDGYVKFATTIPEAANQQAGQVPQAAQIVQNVDAASGVYYTSGEDVGMELHVTATDQSSAETVKEAIDGLLSFAAVGAQGSGLEDLVDATEVAQDQQQVSLSFKYSASELVDTLSELAERDLAS